MAAQTSQAALALKSPEGRWASGPSTRSALTCSMTAWPRCWASAWTRVNGESVKMAWWRHRANSSSWPALCLGLRRLTRRPISLAVVLRAGEGGVAGLGDLRVGDPPLFVLVPDRLGVADGHPRVLADGGDGAFDGCVHAHGDREPGPGPPAGPDHLLGVERRVHPDDDQPGAPHVVSRERCSFTWSDGVSALRSSQARGTLLFGHAKPAAIDRWIQAQSRQRDAIKPCTICNGSRSPAWTARRQRARWTSHDPVRRWRHPRSPRPALRRRPRLRGVVRRCAASARRTPRCR